MNDFLKDPRISKVVRPNDDRQVVEGPRTLGKKIMGARYVGSTAQQCTAFKPPSRVPKGSSLVDQHVDYLSNEVQLFQYGQCDVCDRNRLRGPVRQHQRTRRLGSKPGPRKVRTLRRCFVDRKDDLYRFVRFEVPGKHLGKPNGSGNDAVVITGVSIELKCETSKIGSFVHLSVRFPRFCSSELEQRDLRGVGHHLYRLFVEARRLDIGVKTRRTLGRGHDGPAGVLDDLGVIGGGGSCVRVVSGDDPSDFNIAIGLESLRDGKMPIHPLGTRQSRIRNLANQTLHEAELTALG
ncbi:hypothetical protein BMS3Bbin02_01040 [bacterium BMS3Bbin02]|nr:hypothetical protein BMS3Bbin02_01040 [bacterium BMS3Bbin02]